MVNIRDVKKMIISLVVAGLLIAMFVVDLKTEDEHI